MGYICFVDDGEFDLTQQETIYVSTEDGLEEDTIDQIRKTFVLAGFLVDESKLARLGELIAAAKAEQGLTRFDPVKFNMKDTGLTEHYRVQGRGAQLNAAKTASDALRARMLAALVEVDARALACGIARFAERTPTIDCLGWAAVNLFQRIGLAVPPREGEAYPHLTFVMDRPTGNNWNTLLEVYAAAFEHGRAPRNGQRYYCNSFRSLGAFEAPLFASTLHTPFLQMADILTGATREFLLWAYTAKRPQAAKQWFDPIRTIFHKKDGKVHKNGLKVSPEAGIDLDTKLAELQRWTPPAAAGG
jgi:hypothetical protein